MTKSVDKSYHYYDESPILSNSCRSWVKGDLTKQQKYNRINFYLWLYNQRSIYYIFVERSPVSSILSMCKYCIAIIKVSEYTISSRHKSTDASNLSA